MLAPGGNSDFQILAQFTEDSTAIPHGRGRAAEFGAERIGEVAVAGKTEIEPVRSGLVHAD